MESNRRSPDGFRALVFSSTEGDGPLRCRIEMAQACPYREWDPGPSIGLVPCLCCSKRHRQGSTSQQLCEGWSSAKLVLKEMRRGVTGLNATGMYTGQERTVLMCALTTTEVPHLKALVTKEDPNAFIVVAPAQEVLGKGFIPLNVPNN